MLATIASASRLPSAASRTVLAACPRPSISDCWAKPETPWPYGVTEEMERLADAPPSPEMRSSILAAFLVGAPNTHTAGSSFRSAEQPHLKLAAYVSRLLLLSPGLCAPNVTLHVVHDLNASADELTLLAGSHETRPGFLRVQYHRFPPSDRLLGNDRRWELFLHVLQETEWECAYAVDLSDVVVLRLPPCASLPPKLVAASDGQVKGWLQAVASLTRWNRTLGDDFAAFLTDSRPTLSCSVVGGRRDVFAPALRAVVARMHARARRIEAGGAEGAPDNSSRMERMAHANVLHRPGTDMLLWNDEALRAPALLGFPYGPTSLPPWSTPHLAPGRVCPTHECRHQFVNATRRLYWFGHKTVDSWVADYIGFYRECAPPAAEGKAREKEAAKRGP
ncbi:hypothetical protein AB1Y20_010751 [Prymnesium parvum]|uniref:Uncharacterized protein n=1 Tax=Prymnesium parvum TaxID=97485 RepID=A0AB34IQL8_PRYPA